MITLTPLSSSAASSSSTEPVCYLLQLDEARILLDMGQRDFRSSAAQTSWHYEEKVKELAPTLSLVLLSHSPTNYLSLYPYARARWGLTCPVYATQPTVEMGRVVCLSEVESWRSECAVNGPEEGAVEGEAKGSNKNKGKRPLRGPFVPTAEEVHEAFDWIKAIRYNQPLHLGGDLSHLLLTPFPSGHTLGGTLFKIRSPTSGTVLYAVGINHTSERHLDGMVGGQNGPTGYAEGVLRPDLLIVEGGRSEVVNPKRRERETALLDLVTSTLHSGHSVLLPCDPSPRLLELLILLDQHWTFKLTSAQKKPRQTQQPQGSDAWPYPLCLVSRTGQDMVAFARSLIEWMGGVVKETGGEGVVGDLSATKGKKRKGRGAAAALASEYGALDFRHVQCFATPGDLLQTYPSMRPKLVLAIPPTMSHGPSRFLFTAMANTEGNVVLLTSRSEAGTLARELYERWEKNQEDAAKWGHGRIGKIAFLDGQLEVQMDSKVPLSGAELEERLDAERLQKEREAAHQAAVDRSRRMLEADDLDSDSDSEGSEAGDADGIVIQRRGADTANANAYAGENEDVRTMSFDIYVKGQQMRVGRGAAGEMARFRMFPFLERKGRKVDAYGEGLDIGQWVRKGREIEEEGETEEVREAKKRKEEEEEKQKVPPEPPSKYVTEPIALELRASIFFVDMEGLHDGQSIKTIISDLQPRKLIVVRSTSDSTSSLVKSLVSTAGLTKDIFTPSTDEKIKIGEHVQSYSITLGDSISAGLAKKWSKFEGYEVAMIDGKIAFAPGSTVPVLETSDRVKPLPVEAIDSDSNEKKPGEVVEMTTTGAGAGAGAVTEEPAAQTSAEDGGGQVKSEPEEPLAATQPTEVEDVNSAIQSEPERQPLKPAETVAPSSSAMKTTLPTSLFIGTLRLTSLKSRLSNLTPSIPSEFAGEGILLCGPGILALTEQNQGDDNDDTKKKSKSKGGVVAVKKVGEGGVVLEGTVGRVWDIVRREVQGALARVDAA
ncbi:cleavage and polyadenylation specificity factor subunit 2 [Kwoniella heveanensis BCC8398]|uniref:Cleavage and polyadenylation specificity factor subunit 2 n=1 Tax=Kwoniella heveanensis BCC8398 TaxID=1296120 RepID=A0A1B9GQR8_9TREE|nr:cleavage and polyadenylation specificity factor subunit 2 [Kwoniella heveanensis BCC8398]